MKAAVVRGPGRVAAEDWPRPEVGAGEVLLRLRGGGLCGSDIPKIADPPGPGPLVAGHDVVGDVVATGGDAPFAVGDRVVAAHHVPCEVARRSCRGRRRWCATADLFTSSRAGGARHFPFPWASSTAGS